MTQSDPDLVAFLKAYPTYPTTHIIDDLRSVEYARLDVGGHIYLDYTGGGIYASLSCVATTNCLPNMSSATRIRVTPVRRRPRNSWNMRANMCWNFSTPIPIISCDLHIECQRHIETCRQVIPLSKWTLSFKLRQSQFCERYPSSRMHAMQM